MIYKGVLTALITPFKDNKIDLSALDKLIEKQIKANIDGIIIAGSTGEGNSLSEDEYYELIEYAANHARGRIPIIAGVSSVSTFDAVEKVQKLCQIGIQGIMCTAPHYIRPEQDGLIQHYKSINDATNLPIMIYIHPTRTACNFSDKTLITLAKFDHIVSIKDASSDLEKPLRILPQLENFTMLTGNDSSVLSYNANGGVGCVSVIANILPKLSKKIDSLWRSGNSLEALKLQQKLTPLLSALFIESNPIGIKSAAAQMNLCTEEIRLPLTCSKQDTTEKIAQSLKDLIIMEDNV